MKLMFVCGDISRIGGIEKYNRDFINGLKQLDIQLKVVERYEGGMLAKVSYLFRFLLAYLFFRPNVIMCAHLNYASVCYFLNKLFGTPYTLALYGIEIISLKTLMKYKAVNTAKTIITISDYSKTLILEKFPHLLGQLFMHPSSVDGDLYYIKEKNESLVKKFGLENKKVILSLARLSTPEFKGQDRVLKSMSQVLEKIPNAIYLIVGSGQDLRVDDYLRENPKIREHAVLAGPAEEKNKVDFYNLADVYILPSKFEGFGIVFIEAAACGIPLIASDGFGCYEGLLNGKIGNVVNPDDTTAIASQLVSVIERNEIQEMSLRQKQRDKTLSVYGIEMWNKRISELVDMLRA
jgi:glycosyltransferase involved in cell wall biosynthesis